MKQRSSIKTLLLIIVAICLVLVLGFGLVVGANYATGYFIQGTRPIPGDAARYDPIETFPQIATFAGNNVQLLRINMKFVKADGTLDLTASYGSEVVYRFAQVVGIPDASTIPLGAGGIRSLPVNDTYATRIDVTVTRPGPGGSEQDQYYDFGMDKSLIPVAPLTETIVPTPNCPLKTLWDTAIKNGAPIDAVATIEYSSMGYTFSIAHTQIYLTFNLSCQLKS